VGEIYEPDEKAYVGQLEMEFNGTPQWRGKDQSTEVIPGDLIFFDLEPDPEGEPKADHVGVVLTVLNGKVYTIEGNSFNRVRVRDYLADDSTILGYGVLKWRVETPSGE
jgi:hypothetical protein